VIVNFLLKGIVIGFSIAAPVGPIGVLCIRRSLVDGRAVGFATGLGAATADAAYGCIAGFGLTAISTFLVEQRFWLGIIGAVFLCYLGIRTFIAQPPAQTTARPAASLFSAYVSTLFLTLTNPMTILSFVAIFAGFGLVASPNYLSATALVVGVFCGSALWWLILSNGVGLLRSRLGANWMQRVNQFSGAVILAFGLYALAVSLLRS
jgi:threonine/homoserine/homoserine lactone efflux protein